MAEYRLLVELVSLIPRTDLSPTEIQYATAIDNGIAPDSIQKSERTMARAIASLKRKGIIAVADAPLDKGDEGNAAYQSLADDLPELESFEPMDFLDRDKRFQTFCRLYGCSTEDPPVRTAWLELERNNQRKEPGPVVDGVTVRIPEIAQLCPQIFRCAQLEAFWQRNNQRPQMTAAQWLREEVFNQRVYKGVQLGDPPPEASDDAALLAKVDEMLAEMAEMGAYCVSPHGSEPPMAQYKRIRAKLKQAKRNRALGIDIGA